MLIFNLQVITNINFSPFKYEKRQSNELSDIGGDNFPVVISNFSNLDKIDYDILENLGITYDTKSEKWERLDTSPDYIYIGDSLNIEKVNYQFILNYNSWVKQRNNKNHYPDRLFQMKVQYCLVLQFLKLRRNENCFLDQYLSP